MKTRVTETIFSKDGWVIPMSIVQHIEKYFDKDGKLEQICVITEKTKWNFQYDMWENACWITKKDTAEAFLRAFSDYIAEHDGMIEAPVYKED